MAAVARHRPAPRSVKSSSSISTHNPPPKQTQQQPVSLAKRLLFPHLPAGTDLPPLLASSSAPPELNAELYDFIALALRAFVNPWWTKITRYDKEFVVEVNRILTLVIRVLEGRLISTDLSPLVFRDLPTLVTQHYRDYRNAAGKVSTSYASGGAASLPQLFHQLEPHMAITAEGKIHEDYVRQAVDHILKTCLPSEDYEPDTERYIIREIILKVLLGSVASRITQPWFIYKLILDQLGPPQASKSHSEPTESAPSRPFFSLHTLTFQSLVVFFLSAVQSISTLCLTLISTYRQTRDVIRLVNQTKPRFAAPPSPSKSGVKATADQSEKDNSASANAAAEMSSSPGSTPKSEADVILGAPAGYPAPTSSVSLDASSGYVHAPLEMLAELLSMHDRFTSSTVMSMTEIGGAASSPFLDKLLPYMLYKHVLSTDQITNIVRIAKKALFPNGYPAPPPVDPTPEEQVIIRENLVKRVLEKIPPAASLLFGPTASARTATINALLDPLSSAACNAHLFLFILDLVLLTVFPEMGISNSNLGVNEYNPESTTDGGSTEGVGLGLGVLSRTVSITPPGSGPL